MRAASEAGLDKASRDILRRYYLAMATPFAVDVATTLVYAGVHGRPSIVLPMLAVSAAFLIGLLGIGAHLLIRPIARFMAGEASFAEIEPRLARLPRLSAVWVAVVFAPMLAL